MTIEKRTLLGFPALLILVAIVAMNGTTLGLIVAFIGTTLFFILSRLITNPISHLTNSLKKHSSRITDTSRRISSASKTLATGANIQTAGLKEIFLNLKEAIAKTRATANISQQARRATTDACTVVDEGIDAITRINIALEEIQKSSDQMAEIVKAINKNAFQTELLSLDAVIESARAGESGKGFGFIAEEFRKLAKNSTETAKNTTNLVEQSVKNAQNAIAIAADMNSRHEKIIHSLAKSTDLIGRITTDFQEHTQSIDHINKAIIHLNKITQNNAHCAQNNIDTTGQLNAQARTINEIIAELIACGSNAGEKCAMSHI